MYLAGVDEDDGEIQSDPDDETDEMDHEDRTAVPECTLLESVAAMVVGWTATRDDDGG